MRRLGDDKGRQSRGRCGALDQGRGTAGGLTQCQKRKAGDCILQTSDCNK